MWVGPRFEVEVVVGRETTVQANSRAKAGECSSFAKVKRKTFPKKEKNNAPLFHGFSAAEYPSLKFSYVVWLVQIRYVWNTLSTNTNQNPRNARTRMIIAAGASAIARSARLLFELGSLS